MNLLVAGFAVLNVFMLVFGVLVNYANLLPKVVVQLFRYGRANISNAKPAFITKIEVPKRWFYHFYLYAVLLQLLFTLSVLRLVLLGASSPWLISLINYVGERKLDVNQSTALVAVVLFLFHLCRRLYETLKVSVYSNTKMNLFHYLLAYMHYTGAIFCLVAHTPLVANNNKVSGNAEQSPVYLETFQLISVLAFFIGNYIQNRAHVGLANLRKGNDKKQATGHKIPRGGLFEYVSCPNYFGEIIIYCAMASLFGLRNASWNSCTLWVICNQVTSGIMNHIWYIGTFKDYPPSRKAVLPWIL